MVFPIFHYWYLIKPGISVSLHEYNISPEALGVTGTEVVRESPNAPITEIIVGGDKK